MNATGLALSRPERYPAEGVATRAHAEGRAALLVACILALALRLLLLDAKSIWLDEVFTLQTVADGQAALWAGRSDRDHPPLYFWIMGQAAYLGDSAYALRLPAALAGMLCVPLVFALARTLFGGPVAVTAAWLTALSPLLIWYAQEARSYSALACFGLAAMTGCALVCVGVSKLARIGGWLLFVAGSAVALYTHYAAILLLPAQLALFVALWAADRTRLNRASWIAAGWVATGVAFVPWLRSPAMTDFLAALARDRTYYAQVVERLTGIPLSSLFVPLLVGLPLLLAAALVPVYLIVRGLRHRQAALRGSALLQIVAVVVFLGLLALSVYPRGHSVKRQLLILWPCVIVLMAWCWPWQAAFRRQIALLLAASLAGALVTVVALPKDQWREVTAYVTLNAEADDALVALPHYQAIPFGHYNRGRVAVLTLHAGQVAEELNQVAAAHRRLWVAFHTVDRSGPNAEVEQWLRRHGTLVERRSFYHIDLHLYTLARP